MLPAHHPPTWLVALIGNNYFETCEVHPHASRNECNFYCATCCSRPLCLHCLREHELDGHTLVQIRKASHHDAVRTNEISELVDIDGIQPYIINGAAIVFLDERTHSRPQSQTFSSACATCHRSLHKEYRFCSIGCKLYDAVKLGTGAASLLPTMDANKPFSMDTDKFATSYWPQEGQKASHDAPWHQEAAQDFGNFNPFLHRCASMDDVTAAEVLSSMRSNQYPQPHQPGLAYAY